MAYLPHINDPTIFCDSTVFSDSFDSSSLVLPSSMAKDFTPLVSTKLPTLSKDNVPTRIFPVLPPSHNFLALDNPNVFKSYIQAQVPLAFDDTANLNFLQFSLKLPTPQSMGPVERHHRMQESKFLTKLLANGK